MSNQSTPTKASSSASAAVPAGAAQRPCRNVFIYGFCKNQERGCPFNHEGSTAPPVQTHIIGNAAASASAAGSPDRHTSSSGAAGGGGTNVGRGAHALTYSPGVFTAQHYEHYRSSSQERSFAKSEPTSAVSSPTPSNLRSSVALTTAHSHSHSHGAAAASAATVQQVTQQMSSLGFATDHHQHHYSSMPPSDDSIDHSGGYDHVDGDEHGVEQSTSYFPMILSTPTVAPDSADLDHHLYFPPNPSAHHAQPPPRSMRGLHHFYVHENIRADLTHRAQDCYRPAAPQVAAKLPATVHKYHTLVPLEPNADPALANAAAPSSYLGYPCAWYRATNSETGDVHALMRVIGYRLPASAVGGDGAVLQSVVDMWKKVPDHPGICRLKEGFTTMAFGGESSLVLAYDYFANATTLLSTINQPHPISPTATSGKSASKSNASKSHQQQHHFPEGLLWSYLSQLVSAIHAIHSVGLTLRSSLHASKILVPKPHTPTSTAPPAAVRNRLRLTGLGALEFALAAAAARQGNDPLAEITLGKADLEQAQQADWMALGQIMVTLASSGSSASSSGSSADSKASATRSMTQVQEILRPYQGISTVVYYLLDPNLHKRPEEIVGMCSGAILGEVDALRTHVNRLENEMAKELENGRMARMMIKLNFITERPEFALGPRWSETGDRYLITLFRDYVFHPVDGFGRPVLDVGHIVSCLNKLDVGVDESIMLTSRDERNCLIVTYAELKRCVEETFNELIGGLGTVAS